MTDGHVMDTLNIGLIHTQGGTEQAAQDFYLITEKIYNQKPVTCLFLEFST